MKAPYITKVFSCLVSLFQGEPIVGEHFQLTLGVVLLG